MHIAIVGAGMAGLSCANILRGHGHRVQLFDKGRGAGGRMATRRAATTLGEATFDHGAQYFTARDPAFLAQVAEWERTGAAALWPHAGADAWVGVPGMNMVVKAMAADHEVLFDAKVESIARTDAGWQLRHAGGTEGPFDALILALPAEQAAALLSLHDFDMACVALRARSQPCWTGMFAFDRPLLAPDDPIRDRGIISWAVRNRAKPGREGPESWVVQAQPDWSGLWLEQSPDWVGEQLLDALGSALGLAMPAPLAAAAHRWRYAMSSATGDAALWCSDKAIGACGDWLLGPRVECAWLSGRALALRMLSENTAPAERPESASSIIGL